VKRLLVLLLLPGPKTGPFRTQKIALAVDVDR